MTDISAIFEETLFPVELKNKITGKPIGVTMWIARLDADESANMWFRSRFTIEAVKDREKPVDADSATDFAVEADIRRVAASVKLWDWGGHSFADLGKDPACTMENKLKVFGHPNFSTFLMQLMQEGDKIENFTGKPKEN